MSRAEVVLFVSLVLALLRAHGAHGPSYQAVAHLWVGGLIGAWLVGRNRVNLAAAVALSVVETLAFFGVF